MNTLQKILNAIIGAQEPTYTALPITTDAQHIIELLVDIKKRVDWIAAQFEDDGR